MIEISDRVIVSVFVSVGMLLGAAGCRTTGGSSESFTPCEPEVSAQSLSALPSIEEDIVSLLEAVRDLELKRAAFSRFYVLEDGEQSWRYLLQGLPHHEKTGAFPFADYVARRKEVKAQLEHRAKMLDIQIQLLHEDITSLDGYMLKKHEKQKSDTSE